MCLCCSFRASNSNVGVNTMGGFGKAVARALKLENFVGFTGHTFRRSGMQMLADEGLSIEQLKAHSGHKSDAAARGYFSSSNVQKQNVSNALSVQKGV